MNEAISSEIIIPAELEKAANETGLVADGVQSLKSAFAPHFVRFHDIMEQAKEVKEGQPKEARFLRLKLKDIRVAAEKTRVDLKADSLRRGKAIDGINALLEYQLVPIEKALEEIEKAEERAEAKRKSDLQAARTAELAPYAIPAMAGMDLTMSETLWLPMLDGFKAAHEAKIAAAAKAEADRIAAEVAAAEEKAKREAAAALELLRIQEENLRLSVIAAEERAAREASEKIAAQERAKAESDRREADRLAAVDRAQREAAAELAERIEREKREAAEAALAKIEQERKAKEKAEAERIAADKAKAKKAAAAPDRDKLLVLAATVRSLPVQHLSSDDGLVLSAKIVEQANKFAAWIESEAAKL